MAFRPRSQALPGQILLIRNGAVIRNYGDTRTTEADYGNGLKAAFAAVQAGDTIMCGPLVARLTDATCTVDNVRFIGNQTWIKPTAATNYSYLVRLNGAENCLWDGINFDGESQANSGVGNGLRLESAHLCRLQNFESNEIYGSAGLSRGNGVSIVNSNDVLLKNYYSYGVLYAGVQLYDSDRAELHEIEVVDPDDRCFTWYNSSAMTRLYVSNFKGTTTTSTTTLVPFFNFNGDAALSDCVLKGLQLKAYDHVSAGVMANDTNFRELMKFQNVTRMEISNSYFDHGTNSGTGYTKTVRLEIPSEGAAPEELIIRDSKFAEGFVWGTDDQRVEYADFSGCRFGERQNDTGSLIWRPVATRWINTNCTFNVHASGKAIEPSPYHLGTDSWEFHNCRFLANGSADVEVFGGSYPFMVAKSAGRCIFRGATFDNASTGNWHISRYSQVNLTMSTDASGDMLFNDAAIGTTEVQSVYLTGATGGTFTLTMNSKTTSAIAYNASTAAIKSALDALDTIDEVTVTGSGTIGSPWLITFVGAMEYANVSSLTGSAAGLSGTTPTITISTSTPGVGSGSGTSYHPNPGAGPVYFTDLAVPENGRRIWNVNWSPDATMTVPERGWIAHNGEWKEITTV